MGLPGPDPCPSAPGSPDSGKFRRRFRDRARCVRRASLPGTGATARLRASRRSPLSKHAPPHRGYEALKVWEKRGCPGCPGGQAVSCRGIPHTRWADTPDKFSGSQSAEGLIYCGCYMTVMWVSPERGNLLFCSGDGFFAPSRSKIGIRFRQPDSVNKDKPSVRVFRPRKAGTGPYGREGEWPDYRWSRQTGYGVSEYGRRDRTVQEIAGRLEAGERVCAASVG
jgi:hypothetical protein